MSGLSILYMVLPFPAALLVHGLEGILTEGRWLRKNGEAVKARLPWATGCIDRAKALGTSGLTATIVEEFLIIAAVTFVLFYNIHWGKWIWFALFFAFTAHLFLHIAQAIAARRYVPGLATAILALPYGAYFCYLFLARFPLAPTLLCGLCGVLFAAANHALVTALILRIRKR
jgi:hypothetical protein